VNGPDDVVTVKIPLWVAEQIMKLPNLDGAHWANLDVRINGANETYQAGWAKYVQSAIRRALPREESR